MTGPGWEQRLADIVAKDLDREPGRALDLLRGGKKVSGGARLEFCQFKPANDLNQGLVDRYDANRLVVVLEAPVKKPGGGWGAVDVALYLNGIPVADAELKNEMTGQDVGHAVRQYRYDRDPSDTLLLVPVAGPLRGGHPVGDDGDPARRRRHAVPALQPRLRARRDRRGGQS